MDREWEEAIKRGDRESIRWQLETGADVNARDRYGQTGLMLAARDGNLELVETLILSGADLDMTAKYNLSALMLAIVAGHVEVAKVLARAGADLNIRGTGAPGFAGKTAYDLAVIQGLNELAEDLRSR